MNSPYSPYINRPTIIDDGAGGQQLPAWLIRDAGAFPDVAAAATLLNRVAADITTRADAVGLPVNIALNDVEEVVSELLLIGRTWSGALPPDCADTGLRRRLQSAAFSFLVVLDQDASAGPVRLSPRDEPHIDLGGRDLHELFGTPGLQYHDDPHEEQLLGALQQLVDEHATQDGPLETVVGRFLTALCQLLAERYEVRLIDTDNGEHVSARDDVAGELPAAFAAAWAEVHS
ncbi:hypothetical protein ACQEVZ_60640 [Dactylosporangium sp. CA-152071]|uniref:hypothetical protein n=1 Tax=Dactylosporangium sp. CA-152071 TaxID=3239933 RepID=UPI003D8F9DEA